jgi:hypothetical protein
MSGATSNTMDDAVAIDSGRLSQIILREASDAIIYAGTRGIIRFGTTVWSKSSASPKVRRWANPST